MLLWPFLFQVEVSTDSAHPSTSTQVAYAQLSRDVNRGHSHHHHRSVWCGVAGAAGVGMLLSVFQTDEKKGHSET